MSYKTAICSKSFIAIISSLLTFYLLFWGLVFPIQKVEASVQNTIYVATNGSNSNNGTTTLPLKTIQSALNLAKPGTKIIVKAGTYKEHLVTKTDGTAASPIILQAEGKVVLRGTDNTRIFDLFNNYYTIEGFEFDGGFNEFKSVSKTIDKLMWVEAASFNTVRYNFFHHAQGECIRVLFFSQSNTFEHNTVENCGMRDFVDFRSQSSKNGEGIYIGIAPEQISSSKCKSSECKSLIKSYGLKKNSRDIFTKNNVIKFNFLDTHGNECVDIKEGSNGNIISDNICVSQYDPDSAAFDTRGPRNTFIHNTVGFSSNFESYVAQGDHTSSVRETGHKILGAAFRAGGDKKGDSILNNFVKNDVISYEGSSKVVIKIPLGDNQDIVCQNSVRNQTGDFSSNNVQNSSVCTTEFTTTSDAGVRGCVGHTCLTQNPVPPPTEPPDPIPNDGKPLAPKNIKISSPSDSKVELSWDLVDSATKYNVYWTYSGWDNKFKKLTTTSATSTSTTSPKSNYTYTFYITSVNEDGIESLNSTHVSVLVK